MGNTKREVTVGDTVLTNPGLFGRSLTVTAVTSHQVHCEVQGEPLYRYAKSKLSWNARKSVWEPR